MAERKPIGEIWSLRELRTRMGFVSATRELKRRCEAGAIAGCGIYADQVKYWISVALRETEPAGRAPTTDALIACGEDELVRKIEELHASGKPITSKHILDLQDEWMRELEAKVGREIPSAGELTEEEREESKRITRELHALPPKPPEVKPKEVAAEELEAMKKALEKRIAEMKKKKK